MDTFRDRQKYYAGLIRAMGEMYGYTPQEISEMTPFQVAALCAASPEDAEMEAGGVVRVKAEQWESMTIQQRKALRRNGF